MARLTHLEHRAAVDGPQSPSARGDCEVLVIGGGPAGATIATLLAENGRRVVLVEKDTHPRFHIGESLLPQNLPLLDRLGVRAEIERTSIRKYGIEFVSPFHGKNVCYEFADAWDKRFPYSFQVRRSTFDHILLCNAAAEGVEVVEGCRVTSVEFPEHGPPLVEARDSQGQTLHWTTSFVVDASGRDTLLASQIGAKKRNPRNNSAAIFAHYSGARRLAGKAEGNISIVWFDNGWFWFIPLADGATSVGAVCPAEFLKNRRAGLATFFRTVVASCPEIADRLKDAELIGEVQATGNYSYDSSCTSGRNFLLVGDACAFIDPVFSTGVYFAMTMAFRGAEAVEACLRAPNRSARILKRYDATISEVLGAFSWFIYRIREPAMRNLFMSPRNVFRVQEAVLALLAGDLIAGWSIRVRLRLFQAIYYATKLSHLRHRLWAHNKPPATRRVGASV